tara:strand:- start:366 stop:854 length:489 start_codon:yes stop_codon:yes gene_type:complete
MKIIGKFKIKGKLRTVYNIKIKNKQKYYYREKNKKKYIRKPRDYSKKYSKYKYNKGSKSKSFDVYLDKNPKDTISIKYKTLSDVNSTINKLERLFKSGKYTHKRIWQVGMIMYVRLRAIKGKQKQKALAKKYYKFLGKRTKEKGKNKEETFKKRKKMKFKKT